MDYSKYLAADFADDASFRNWVRNTNAADVALWETWIREHPEKSREVEKAMQLVKALSHFQGLGLEQAAIEQEIWRFRNAITQSAEANFNPARQQKSVKNVIGFTPWLHMAAAFIGILLLAGGSYLLTGYLNDPMERFQTANAQVQTIPLPDGSVATLNANSRLWFAEEWSANAPREVWLEGEAFFDVQKQKPTAARQPGNARFIVHSHDWQVEVLGTEFNVNNRRGKTQVVLQTGKVKIQPVNSNDTSALTMEPGDMVVVSAKNHVQRKKVTPRMYTSWVDGVLQFENTPLPDVIQLIEDKYGWQVELEDSTLASKQLNGSLPAAEGQVLLEALSAILRVEITRQDQKVIIHKLNH
jgi:transmembrane sensor